jgi:carboxylesterase type B
MQYNYNGWEPSQCYHAFAQAAGCFPGQAYGNTSTKIIDCLRQADTAILQNASNYVSASGTWGTWAFLPVTDGTFVQQRPSAQLTSGKVNGIRVLSGNNALEGAAFVIPDITTEADFEDWLRLEYPLLSPSDIDQILTVYYPPLNISTIPYATCGDCGGATAVDVSSEWVSISPPYYFIPFLPNHIVTQVGPQQRAVNLYSETTFDCPSYWLAQAFSSGTNGTDRTKQAYKYQYSIPVAQHGADLNAEGLRAPTPNVSPQLYEAFTTMWGNFITAGDPSITSVLANGNGSTAVNAASDWPVFETTGTEAWKMMNINETGGVEYEAHVVSLLTDRPSAPRYSDRTHPIERGSRLLVSNDQ